MIACHNRITWRRGDMLEIVLLILKIAGVIFVSVLGILIVLTGIALFVPVRYRGDFLVSDKADSEKKAAVAKLRATWLLRLVRVYVTYEDTLRIQLKLLFFTLTDTAKEKKAKRGRKEKKKKDKEDKEEKRGESEEKPGNGDKVKETPEEDTETSPEKEKKTIKSRISNLLQTSRGFCDKLKEIKQKAEKTENLWTSGYMANSRALLARQLRYLLKHTKPKKLSGYLRFGFDDPSITGYAMAAYGILYPIWSPELSVEPDFEKQVLDCHILLKGKIRVWHIVRAALRMILSKDVRRVIKDVRNF